MKPLTHPHDGGFYTVGAATVPVKHSPFLLRLSGAPSSCVYSLMYRYICIDFGYLSVIVSSAGLIVFFCPGPQLNWLEFVPSPSQSDYKPLSALSPFPPYASLHLSASISRHTRSQSPPRSEAQGPALPRPHDPGPRVFWLLTPTRASSSNHTTAAGPLLVGPVKRRATIKTDPNSQHRSGCFLTCSMET